MSPRFRRIALVGSFLVPALLLGWFVRLLFSPVNIEERLEAVKSASVVLDRRGQEVAKLYGQGRVWVPLSKIPVFLRQAVVATEDTRFYEHHGVDLKGILRALYHNIRAGRIEQGGSTITQQLAKIIFLTTKRTFWRKLEDAAFALRIERSYSKDQILEFYLNHVYLGHGAVGVEAAAQTYFGRHVEELNQRETAMIAGLIKGPEYYTPFRNEKAASGRIDTVLAAMRHTGRLSAAEVKKVGAQPLRLLPSPGRSYPGGYFVAHVLNELHQQFGWSEEYIRRAGLEIRTTMDIGQQRAAEDTMRLLPVGYKDAEGVPQPQGAIVAIDPADGAIRALVSGRDFLTAPLDRAARSRRQPGSAIKPFAFAAALETGYTPDTTFVDEPTEFWINGQVWRPKNYDDKYRGPITLRQALEESVNIIAARLVQELGPGKVFALARQMGLTGLVASGKRNDVGLAPMALGGLTRGVTPLELTAAYAAFANGGWRIDPYCYTTVVDRKGETIAAAAPRRQRVISAQTAFHLTEMMRGVIARGTGTRADISRPAAGKTGTTSDYTDGWFIGFTPQLVAGVWIGNDSSAKPMRTEEGFLGSGVAAAMWGVFTTRALAGEPVRDFTPPWEGAPFAPVG